jgi:hypothetical protein
MGFGLSWALIAVVGIARLAPAKTVVCKNFLRLNDFSIIS